MSTRGAVRLFPEHFPRKVGQLPASRPDPARNVPRLVMILMVAALSLSTSYSQPFELQLHPPLQIIQNGSVIINPFSGGVNRPIYQFVDIDGDGDEDLFVLDDDGHLNFYRHTGSPEHPQFKHEAVRFHDLNVGTWFRFVDIDRDGDNDLFCNGGGFTVAFLRNVGSSNAPAFVKEVGTLTTHDGMVVVADQQSAHAFADVDGDEDHDFFSGDPAGRIVYYENIGSAQAFSFRFVTERYQNIEIVGIGGRIALPSLDADAISQRSMRHGAMAIDFADVDASGTLDLFWGDFFNTSLYVLENRGTPTNPQLVLTDSTYPKPNPVMTSGFNMPQLVDIDGDGDFDLFIGVLSGFTTAENFLFYRNHGTPQSPQFVLETSSFLPTVDVGAASSPVFVDIDGDGDLDLVIGTEEGKLVHFERTGKFTFEHQTDRLVDLSGLFNVSPTFGDLDGDGHLDLIVGDANGRLRLFRGPDFAEEDTTFSLRSVSFGQNAAPALVDLRSVGLLDLVVGTGGGQIIHYHNIGTDTSSRFALPANTFESIDVGDDAKPTFIDLDGDDRLDLVVGSRDSSVFLFRNDGGSRPAFTRLPNAFAGQLRFSRTAPAFADLDEDGDTDLLLGTYKGGLYFYRNDRMVSSVEERSIPSFRLEQNYPNPFNPSTRIRFMLHEGGFVTLRVFDVLGRELSRLVDEERRSGTYEVTWDAIGFASGMYFYRLTAGEFVQTRAMMLIR
jgi:hypothetical protein